MQPRGTASHAIEQAGAAGFFVKGIETARLIQHLLVVHAGARRRPLHQVVMQTRPRVLARG